ncbi:MAG: Holliday junction branch migration DNA helicase RuvB [Candidatus Levybacteria bacterium]|nr:Holliday junction branch migration DNA helicase RuvB [Candidatus Levybacteria bacterium]
MKNNNDLSSNRLEEQSPEEEVVLTSLRAGDWKEFTGQESIKQSLKIAIQAAKKREEALEHVLLYGPPGLGKTTLSHIIAHEMGSTIRVTSGPAIERAGDLASILTNLEKGDILFIDEIHRLNKVVEETLYPAMEDYALDIILGKGPSARTLRLDLPQFTIVGATTRVGLLSAPLRDRFGVVHRLNFYTSDDLEVINAQVHGEGEIISAITAKALGLLEIDILGLDPLDVKYIKAVVEKHSGGPVGIETIASTLSEDIGTLEDMVEPYLMQIGFLKRSPRGRIITKAAYQHLNLPHASSDQQTLL